MKIANKRVQSDETGRITAIPVAKIRPNPCQPRKTFDTAALLRLAESIREYGMLQPIPVRRLSGEERDAEDPCSGFTLVCDPTAPSAEYEIIAGERRLRAAKILGLREVPCILLPVSGARSAELSLIENLQREALNPFEQASAIASLIDLYGLTQEQIARRLSSSQSYVANKLRLLRLTQAERDLILASDLTERHARALLVLPTPEARLSLLRVVIDKSLNVAQTEALAASQLQPKKKRARVSKFAFGDLRAVCNTLDRAIGTISQTGIRVQREQRETDTFLEIVLRIPKSGSEGRGNGEDGPPAARFLERKRGKELL